MTAYADRYGAGPKFKPGSMGLALALTVLPVAGLVVSLQINQIIQAPPKHIDVVNIKEPPPPPPDPDPKPVESKPIQQQIYAPVPPVPLPPQPVPIDLTPTPPVNPPPPTPVGSGTVLTPPPVVAIKAPVMVEAMYDQRYANALQPAYPAEEIRSGNEGRVVLRVLIGTDGRVKDVVKVSAASDAFFASAQRQALGKWRFKPATRDGVPIEQWKVMSLRFKLDTSE